MKNIFTILKPLLAVMIGLAIGLLITKAAGENPWLVLKVLLKGAFGSSYDFGMTLFYATPLIFTGLAVAVPLQAGLFNIGAEGQLTLGALAAAMVGISLPGLASPWAPILAGLAAFAAGAVWGAIPGWLRARRGSHEVINTIMLNFIATGLASYFTLYLFKTTDSQNPETQAVGAGYLISHLAIFGEAPVSSALFVAIAVTILVWIFLRKTIWGYELRAVGSNEHAARAGGIHAPAVQIWAMALGGGLAGLVGIAEVLGSAGRFRVGFSPEYGFIGIAVALLGRGNPLGIFAAALLFGALHKGSLDLDLDTENVTRDLALILQALVILAVSADGLWTLFGKKAKGAMK